MEVVSISLNDTKLIYKKTGVAPIKIDMTNNRRVLKKYKSNLARFLSIKRSLTSSSNDELSIMSNCLTEEMDNL